MLFKICLFATQALLLSASSPIKNDADLLGAIAEIRQFLTTGQFIQANERILHVHHFLTRKAGPGNCRPTTKLTGAMLNEPKLNEVFLDKLEQSVTASDYGTGCQNAMLLGIVSQRDSSTLPAAARLSQQEQAWRSEGSPSNIPWCDRLAWANLEAGQIGSAAEFASRLETLASSRAMKDQPEVFLHSARTVLGLARLQANGRSTGEAAQLLKSSIEFESPGFMFLANRPAVRLANALWEKGERTAVIDYLEKAATFQWTSPATKSTVTAWLNEAKAGRQPTFTGLTSGIYSR